jgi:hypothetical protein
VRPPSCSRGLSGESQNGQARPPCPPRAHHDCRHGLRQRAGDDQPTIGSASARPTEPGCRTASLFDRIVVISNPQSTGKAPQLAEQLRVNLVDRLPMTPVRLTPTERLGHARELASSAAQTGRPLIISVSGDGATTRSSTGSYRPVMRTWCAR